MARLMVCDHAGRVTAAVEVHDPVLCGVFDHAHAEAVMRCALLMAVSALAEGGTWPATALAWCAHFMTSLKAEVVETRLM
jgi:hypothetical protein